MPLKVEKFQLLLCLILFDKKLLKDKKYLSFLGQTLILRALQSLCEPVSIKVSPSYLPFQESLKLLELISHPLVSA